MPRLLRYVLIGSALSFQPLAAQQAEAPAKFAVQLSSGLFSMPPDANSVDWAVLNTSPDSQRVRVTVYRVSSSGSKTAVWPGVMAFSIGPGRLFHNANSVGPTTPNGRGLYYEVILEMNDRRILPTVTVWNDGTNTLIPGIRFGPRDFVEIPH